MSDVERTSAPMRPNPGLAWLPFPWRIFAVGWVFLFCVISLAYADSLLGVCCTHDVFGRAVTIYLTLFIPMLAFAPVIATTICLMLCLPLAAFRRWRLAGHALAAAALGAAMWLILATIWLDWSHRLEAERLMKMPL